MAQGNILKLHSTNTREGGGVEGGRGGGGSHYKIADKRAMWASKACTFESLHIQIVPLKIALEPFNPDILHPEKKLTVHETWIKIQYHG